MGPDSRLVSPQWHQLYLVVQPSRLSRPVMQHGTGFSQLPARTARDVRVGSLADIKPSGHEVRFAPECRHPRPHDLG